MSNVRTSPMSAVGAMSTSLDTVDPATIKRGVRLFVLVLDKLLRVYGKWEVNINPVLPGGVATALGALIAALAEINALNKPGPQ